MLASTLDAVIVHVARQAMLRSHPSIVCWVPFNEGWGQHNTRGVTEWLRATDPTRLINSASGGCDPPPCGGTDGVGDMYDIHQVRSLCWPCSKLFAFRTHTNVYEHLLRPMAWCWTNHCSIRGQPACPMPLWTLRTSRPNE